MKNPKDSPMILPGTDGECGIPFRTDKEGNAIQDSISVIKNSTLSDDKQFQERLAAEIQLRVANQSQDAWKEYLQAHRHLYPDYTMMELSKKGNDWRVNWMVARLCEETARTTATMVDLLGIATDLRALSKAKSPAEMEDIAGELRRRFIFGKQAE